MSANVCPSEVNNHNSSFEAVRFCANTVWANRVDSFHRANHRLWIATTRLNCQDSDVTGVDRSVVVCGGGGATIPRSEVVRANDGASAVVEETKCHELFGRNRNTGGPWLLPEVEAALRRFTSEVGSRHDSIWTNKVVETRSSILFGRQCSSTQLKTRASVRYPAGGLPTTFTSHGEERCSATDLTIAEEDPDEVYPCAEVVPYKVRTPEDRELHKKIASYKVKRIWYNSNAASPSCVTSQTSSLGYYGLHDVNPTTLNANVPEFFPNATAAMAPTCADALHHRRPPLVFPSSLKGGYEDVLFPYRNTSADDATRGPLPSPPRSPAGRQVARSPLSDASNYLPIPLPPLDPSSARGGSCKGSPRDEAPKRTTTSTLASGTRASQTVAARNVTNWRVAATPPATQGCDLSPQGGCSTSFWSSFTKHHHKTGASSASNKFKRESYASLSARSSIYRNSSPDKDGSAAVLLQAGSNAFRGTGSKPSDDPPAAGVDNGGSPFGSGSGNGSPRSNKNTMTQQGETPHAMLTTRSCDASPYASHGGPDEWSSVARSSAPPSLFSVPVGPAPCCAACPSLGRPGVYPRNIPVYQRPLEFYLTPDVMLHAEKKHQGRGADHSNLIVLTGSNKRHFHHAAAAKAAYPLVGDAPSVAMERDFPPLIMVDPEPSPPGVDDEDESLQLLNGNHDHDFKRQMDWLRKYYASRVDWFTHASLLSDELALIEEQTVMEALEDIERDCNAEFPPISGASKRSPQKKSQPVEVSLPQGGRTPSETSLDLAATESRRDVAYVVQPKLSYKDVLASPAPLKSGESLHEFEKLPAEETKTPSNTLQVTKSSEESFVVYSKYQETPPQKQQATEKSLAKQQAAPTTTTLGKSAKRTPGIEATSVVRSEVKPPPPSLLSLGPIKRPPMLANASQSQHDLRAAAKVTPATLSKSYTRVDEKVSKGVAVVVVRESTREVVEPVKEMVLATPPKSPWKRGCTKMTLVPTPATTTTLSPHRPEEDPDEGDDGPLIVLAAPSSPGTKGLRLLVQEVYKDKTAVVKGKKKKKRATTVVASPPPPPPPPPDGDERNNGEVETGSVSRPDPNEERTQVSTTTSLQPAKTITDSEPQVQSPPTDKVQGTWDTAEVNAASTPIACTPPRNGERSTPSEVNYATPPPTSASFRNDASRGSGTSATAATEPLEVRGGRRSSGVATPTRSKPVWMRRKKKCTSSGNKKRQRGGGARGWRWQPGFGSSPPRQPASVGASCCELNAEWLRTGDVRFPLGERLKDVEVEILYFKDLAAVKMRDRTSRDDAARSDGLLCVKVAENIREVLPKMRRVLQDFDSVYKMCVNCELGKMIFKKVTELKMHFETLETQLLSQGLDCLICYVKEFIEPSETQCERLDYKILSSFQSEYAACVLLYHGNPKAMFLQSLITKLSDYHEIRLSNKKLTIFECIPSTFCFTVALSLKHTMMDLKMYLGKDTKNIHATKSVQIVSQTPAIDYPKHQLINSRRNLRRELFKPAPPLRNSNEYKQGYLEGCSAVMSYHENQKKVPSAGAPKVKVAPNKSKTTAKQEKKETTSPKNGNIQSVSTLPKEIVAGPQCQRMSRERVDKREAVRREMERAARDRLARCRQMCKPARSASAPAVMITSNVKSAPSYVMCKECASICRKRRLKSISCCYATDEPKPPVNLKDVDHDIVPVSNDITDKSPLVVKNLMSSLRKGQGEELSTITPPPHRGLTVKADQSSCGDKTFYCCLEKVAAIRNLVNNYENSSSQMARSHLFVKVAKYLDERPCSVRVIKRERPLVWPTHVKPAHIVVMVEKLQKQFIINESQAQVFQHIRRDETKCEMQNLANEFKISGHSDEDINQTKDSALDEENGEEDVKHNSVSDTKIFTNIPQGIQRTETGEDNGPTEKTDEHQEPTETTFVGVRDGGHQNACQTGREPDASRKVTPSRDGSVASPHGDGGEPAHPLRTDSSRTDLIVPAVKRKMHGPAPDVVPNGVVAVGPRGGAARQNSHHHHHHHHHERSESTSCTLY